MNVVFDIGGTNMRVAVANGDVLGEIRKVPTPHVFSEAIEQLAAIARELAGRVPIERAAGCVSGSVSPAGMISDARNLSSWEGENISRAISDALGVPVMAVNDAGCVGLGEAMHGAGRGFRAVGYVTVSTGVGGAKVTDGKIEAAGGIGWTPVGDSDLESSVSGTAVQKKFGIHPKEHDSLEERNKLADILAVGLTEIATKWRPDVFVLGGSMIVGVNPIPLERVRETFTAVPIKMAELGDNGGLIGAAVLAVESPTPPSAQAQPADRQDRPAS